MEYHSPEARAVPLPFTSLNWLLLVLCIVIIVVVSFFLFYFNRLVAWLFAWVIRILFWRKSNVWIELEGLQLSLLAGRIFIKDLEYHSRNISVRVLKCHITWRYWLWRTQTNLPGTETSVEGETLLKTDKAAGLPCRIHAGLEGVELFLYNRTAAYDEIISHFAQADEVAPADVFAASEETSTRPRGFSLDDPRVHKSTRATVVTHNTGRSQPRSTFMSLEPFSQAIKTASDWAHGLVPTFDITDILPISFEASKCAIVAGNDSTPSVLIGEVQVITGTYGVTTCRSKLDLYKDVYSLKMSSVKIITRTNPDYQISMVERGEMIQRDLAASIPAELQYQNSFLHFAAFRRLVKLHGDLIRKLTPKPAPKWKGLPRYMTDAQRREAGELTHDVEYAKVTSLLETSVLDAVYSVDVPGVVPDEPRHLGGAGQEVIDIGNGDLAPEWTLELALHGGSVTYGPWADRQRDALQKAFFPPTYETRTPTPQVQPGAPRMHTSLVLHLELKDNAMLRLPTRESSKDWKYDGVAPVADSRRKKEKRPFGWIDISLGTTSTLTYSMSMVSDDKGFRNSLEVHLRQPEILSSVNGTSFWRSASCRILCDMPAPLQWNGSRQWTFDISFNSPTIHLLRDHVTLITDLINDWTSGPPSDFNTFVPTVYGFKFGFKDYKLLLYTNDHNIIDHPLSESKNSFVVASGPSIRLELLVRSDRFRPLFSTTTFWAEIPRLDVAMSLPDWNTYYTFAKQREVALGSVGFVRLDSSYTSYPDVHPDHVEKFVIDVKARNIGFKCHAWCIRHFLRLKDNYFGSFTHFSTSQEYMEKKGRGVIGDPVTAKYRKDQANVFEVTLALNLLDNRVALPQNIHGCEAGLALACSEFQIFLRLHDFFLEMSCNAAPATLVATNDADAFLKEGIPRVARGGRLAIAGLDIMAHRLFGPQPHTATYVCVWEIRLGAIHAVLLPRLTLAIRYAMTVFQVNYVDPLNAPDDSFELPVDPDVTFLKVSIPAANITLKDSNSAVNLALNNGFRFDFNDFPGQKYGKVISVRLPSGQVRGLLRSPYKKDHWSEVASCNFDCYTDWYLSPPGWNDHADRQLRFIAQQDAPTKRVRFLYEHDRDRGRKAMTEVYLPSLQVPTAHPRRRRQAPRRPSPVASSSEDSESGSEILTENERRARVTASRPLGPNSGTALADSPESDSSFSSGDESDRGRRSPSPASSSDTELSEVPSDSSDSPRWPKFEHYHHVLNRYRVSTQDPLDAPAFILARDPIDVLQWGNEVAGAVEGEEAPPSASFKTLEDSVVGVSSVIRLRFQRPLELRVTPLIVPAIRSLYASFEQCHMPLGVRLDALLSDYLSKASATSSQPSATLVDLLLPELRASVLQRVDALHAHSYSAGSPTQLMTAANARVTNVNLSISTRPQTSTKQPLALDLSLWFQAINLHVHTTTSHPRSKAFVTQSLLRARAQGLAVSVNAGEKSIISSKLDYLDAKLSGKSPKLIATTFESLVRFVSKVASTASQNALREARRRQYMAYAILQLNPEKSVWTDPLSWTQASFIVKAGLPAKLRADLSWKVIAHIRHRLLDMQPQDLNQLDKRIYDVSSDIAPPPRDFVSELMEGQQWLDWARDPGDPTSSPILVDLLYPPLTPHQNLGTVQRSGEFKFAFGRCTCVIAGEDNVNSSVTFGPVSGGIELGRRQLDVQNPSPSHTSDETTLHILASLVVDDFGIHVQPTFIPFLSEILRVQGRATRLRPGSQSPSSNSPMVLEVTLDVRQAIFEALALKLVLGMKATAVHASASVTVLPVPGSVPITGSCSLLTEEFRVGTKATPVGSKNAADQNTLAELVFGHSAVNVLYKDAAHERHIGVVLGQDKIFIHVPRSALKLYHFVREWRTEYMSKYDTMMRELIAEFGRAPPTQTAPSTPSSSKPFRWGGHMSLKHSRVLLQVMHGAALSWEVGNASIFVEGKDLSSLDAEFTVDLDYQKVDIISRTIDTKLQSPLPKTHAIRLPLPRFTAKGLWSPRKRNFALTLGRFDLKLKPQYVDDILTIQQKFGSDFGDLLDLYSAKREPSNTPEPSQSRSASHVPLEGTASLAGFTISLEGPSSTQYLNVGEITGQIGDHPEAGLTWQAEFRTISLSLAHHSAPKAARLGFDRRFRSAYMEVELQINNLSPEQSIRGGKYLNIRVAKIHAVMQAASFGELGDLVDYVRGEMTVRKEQRAVELEEILQKGRLLKTKFDLEPSRTKDATAFWDDQCISIDVLSVGVAFPLSAGEDVMPTHSAHRPVTPFAPSSVRAFLFSINTIRFMAQKSEKGTVEIKNLTFQFVSGFDQSNPSHFQGDSHATHNRLRLPSMEAMLDYEKVAGSLPRITTKADVDGLELDLDTSIPNYVFSLVEVYRQGKDRIERIAPGQARANLEALHSRIASTEAVESHLTAVSSSNIGANLKFHNGRIRLFSTDLAIPIGSHGMLRESSGVGNVPLFSDDGRMLESGVDIVTLPSLAIDANLAGSSPAQKLAMAAEEAVPPRLTIKAKVTTSSNTIRPTVLPFFVELVRNVEVHMQATSLQSQTTLVAVDRAIPDAMTDSSPSFIPAAAEAIGGHFAAEFSLEIEESTLTFSCQPDANVSATLEWGTTHAIATVRHKTHELSVVATVGSVTAVLKHEYLQITAVDAGARGLVLNVKAKREEAMVKDNSPPGVFVTFATDVKGLLKFSRLQDVLCFKAVWLDRIPVFESRTRSDLPTTPLRPPAPIMPPAPPSSETRMSLKVAVILRTVDVTIDLGRSITLLRCQLQMLSVERTQTPDRSEFRVQITFIDVGASHSLSGRLTMPEFVFEAIRHVKRRKDPTNGQSNELEVLIKTGELDMVLQDERREVLELHADALSTKVWDSLPSASSECGLRLDFALDCGKIVATARHTAAAQLIGTAAKVKALVQAQKRGAAQESKAFATTLHSKPANPLSDVAATMLRSQFQDTEQYDIGIIQQMQVQVASLQLRLQHDVAMLSAQADKVVAKLERNVRTDNASTSRDLHLSLGMFSVQSIPAHDLKATVGVPKTFFMSPELYIRMRSTLHQDPPLLKYEFESIFPGSSGGGQTQLDLALDIVAYSGLYAGWHALTTSVTEALKDPVFQDDPEQWIADALRDPSASLAAPETSPGNDEANALVLSAHESNLSRTPQELTYESLLTKVESPPFKLFDKEMVNQFFSRFTKINVKSDLPQWVHQYATIPIETVMKVLLAVYAQRLRKGDGSARQASMGSVDI